MDKEIKKEKAIEWLENALTNIQTAKKGFLPVLNIAEQQISNAVLYLKDEEVNDDVLGK